MRNSTPLLLLLTACLAWPFLAPATNPLIVDDADPSLPGEVWVDASAGLAAYDNHRDWDMPLCVAYGLATNLEISVLSGVHRLTAEDNDGNHGHVLGHNDLWLGAKWRFCEEDGLLPRQVLEPSVKLPTAATRHGQGSGTPDYDLLWGASWAFCDSWQADLNAGYTWVGQPKHRVSDEYDGDLLHGGVALEYQFSENWQWVGEVVAQQELVSHEEIVLQANSGLRWFLSDTWSLNGAVGTRLRGEAPDLYATLGISWLYDTKGAP